jgi:histidinol dehydrogenase
MKIRVLDWQTASSSEKLDMIRRPVQSSDQFLTQKVREIIEAVKTEKDAALFRFTQQFDQVCLPTFKVSSEEVQEAYRVLEPVTLSALKEAIRRVSVFHQAQFPQSIDLETSTGVRCERKFLPIRRVGLYVPGGTAPLPSTVIMLGVPSRIAGCPTRVLLTPPRADQSIAPAILVAADLLGIRDIYKLGGAQAIAAIAYGTQSIPKVDKIFGPGNSWVTEAKLQVSHDPAGAVCDLPAGPSEVMVIADKTANPAFVAADLLSQAEHGIDSQVILVTDSKSLLDDVQVELAQQLIKLPRREIAEKALSHSLMIQVPQIEKAIEICNDYAPEHLILQVENARKFSESIENAGSVFLGPWTPESMGDYASGTNHVLPTYGFARALSGLSTESFLKSITFQELTLVGLRELAPVVEELAKAEGLDAHKRAVQIRLERERR